jgi:hypothetical protein
MKTSEDNYTLALREQDQIMQTFAESAEIEVARKRAPRPRSHTDRLALSVMEHLRNFVRLRIRFRS